MNGPSNTSRGMDSFIPSNPTSSQQDFYPLDSSKEDGRKSTRRKACDTCQRRKVKCDLSNKPKCSQCEKMGIACTRNLQRYQANLRRQAMINHLEGSLERMESRLQGLGFTVGENDTIIGPSSSDLVGDISPLRLSSSPTDRSPVAEDADDADWGNIYTSPPPGSTHPTASRSPSPHIPNMFGQPTQAQAAIPCFNVPRYLGGILNSGCFSMISREGLEWIAEKTGGESLDHLTRLVLTEERDGFMADYPLHCISPRRVFCPLPPQEHIVRLVERYLEDFNVTIPLFRRSDLILLFEKAHLDMRCQSPGQWAIMNAVLAVAYMLPDNGVSKQPDHQKSWLLLKNALEAVNELYLGPPDLRGLQALLVMVVLFMAASAARPCNFLISVAIHISDQLGLGTTEGISIFTDEEKQDRQTVFWLAYCLDREISFRFGEPPVQNDEAISAALPKDAPGFLVYSLPRTDQAGSFSAFASACKLAQIRGEIYQRLYSASAADRPFHQILAAVGDLDGKLQAWKDSLPSEFQPESPTHFHFRQTPMSIVLLHMHNTYHNCMIAIHSLIAARGINSAQDLSDHPGYTINPDSLSNPRVLLSASLTSKAARASIGLMKYLPKDDISLGLTMYFPTVALKTLASSIVRNPRDTGQIYNMRILDQAEAFLSSTSAGTTSEGMKRLVKNCAEFRSLAERAMKECV